MSLANKQKERKKKVQHIFPCICVVGSKFPKHSLKM